MKRRDFLAAVLAMSLGAACSTSAAQEITVYESPT